GRSMRRRMRICSINSRSRSNEASVAEKATIARPYARAAFGYAREAKALAAWSDALTGAVAVVGDARVRKLLGKPKVSPTKLINFIDDVLSNSGNGKLDTNVRNFLSELAANRRIGLLPEVAAMFETMRNEVENIADVRITSAVALNDAQRTRF